MTDERDAAAGAELDRAALAGWLSDLLGTGLAPARLGLRRPSGGGWSSDTVFVDTGVAEPARVVVRLAPGGPTMFEDHDLGRQCAVLRALAAAPDVPVPPVLGSDLDGARLGRPAFVMGYVAGRVPSDDRPSFAEAGFLFDATTAEQRTFHTALLDALAAIHATPVTAALRSTLRPAAGAADGSAAAALDGLARTWSFDQGPCSAGAVDDGFRLLRASLPPPTPGEDVLLWGDARPANVIVAADRFEPVALLDWELATIGPAEFDLTWLAEMNRMRMEGSGVAPLPGLLSDDEARRHYEQRSGRTLGDLRWYRLYSALRIAVLMHRHLRVMVHLGRLPAEHPVFEENVATRRLEQLATA